MSVLIRNGRIVTAADDYIADIFIANERISLIGESLDVEADQVFDAGGKYVLPGGVDVHTHMDTLFGGTTTADNHFDGTVSAAFGGTTTVVDFAVQYPGESFAEGLKKDLAAVQAALDTPWSTSPVEGQISRLKTIKRTMYGRAGFALLRSRVLHAA